MIFQNKIKYLPCIFMLFIWIFMGVHAQESYLSERWEIIEFGEYLGGSGLASVDLDGDGSEEIIMKGSFYNESYFCILEITEKEFVVKWSSRLYASGYWDNAGIRELKPYNLDGDNDYEIYVLCGNGLFECYDGSTMEIIQTEVLDAELADDFVFDDLDADGNLDLILTSEHYEIGKYIKIFDPSDYSLTWETYDYGDNSIAVGDVDHDNVKEIVLSNGIVIDGITKNLDWEYPDEFGWEIQLADIDGDQYEEIIGGMSDTIRAYDGQLQERLWDIITDNRCAALLVDDLDGDGEMEIVHGDFDRDGLKCYSATTQELIWHCEDAQSNISQISLGDPDNDSEKELLWGTGHGSTGADYLMITTANTGINERHTPDLDGHFSFDISDLDKDDNLELGISCYKTNRYLNGGNVFIYENANHELLAVVDSISYYSPISCMKMCNINDTEQDEIILGFSDGYNNKSIMILDGLTYEILYETNDYGSIYSLETGDIDGDGIVEIVFGNHGSIVHIMNGETFELEWETEYIGWYQYLVRQIFLKNIDDDGALEVIYWTENDLILHAYDGVTGVEEAVSEEFELLSAVDVSDINIDGQMEICIADKNGHVTVLDGSLQNVIDQFYLQDEPISSIKFCNIDDDAQKEILCGSSRFRVFSGNHHYLLWESKRLLEDENDYVTIQDINAVDLDKNGRMDVFCANRRGLFQYECDEEYVDFTPSFQNPDADWSVVSTYPDPQNPDFIKTSTKVFAYLSDTIIDDEKWSELFSASDTNFTSELSFLGNILEKDGIVQFMGADKSIQTLYNFNLSVGDEVSYNFDSGSELLQIENIDSVFIDGEYFKRFYFSEPGASPYFLKEVWIEGIGSVHGPLFPLEPELFSSELPDSLNLSCYQVKHSILWHNPYYETCYQSDNLSIPDKEKDEIRIFPNPVNDVLNIVFPETANGITRVSIFDILGKEMQNTSFGPVQDLFVNTVSLSKGIYFIKIESEGVVYVQKFLKR